MVHDPAAERFVRLFLQAEQEVFRYVYALAPNASDAQDIVQNTAVALLQKFSEYDPEQPFVPWACRFAYFEVCRYRRERSQRGLQLSAETIDLLAADHLASREVLDDRLKALAECLGKLAPPDRELLSLRYTGDSSIRQLAEETGRSVHTLYKKLERIRNSLVLCVNRAVDAEEHS